MSGNKMKVFLAIGLVLMMAVPVFAADSATLNLSATMPAVKEITVEAAAVNPLADLSTLTSQTVTIANLISKCNSKVGFKIFVQSDKGGYLKTGDGLSSIAYTLQYGTSGTAVTPGTTKVQLVAVSGKTTKAGASESLNATLANFGDTDYFYDAGTYTDTLTISIEAQ